MSEISITKHYREKFLLYLLKIQKKPTKTSEISIAENRYLQQFLEYFLTVKKTHQNVTNFNR